MGHAFVMIIKRPIAALEARMYSIVHPVVIVIYPVDTILIPGTYQENAHVYII